MPNRLQQESTPAITVRELTLPSNLVSLTRIPLAFLLGYLLSMSGNRTELAAAAVFVIAGITDFLDGYLARRQNRITALGIALDPICDKIFAAVTVVFLILYRAFPLPLAAAILGRDLLILAGGLWLRRKYVVPVPSNLTGKYTFAAVAVLAGSYVIRYQLGITMATVTVVLLLIASTIVYARVFRQVNSGRPVPVFRDRAWVKYTRIGLTWLFSAVYLVELYVDKFR